MTTIMNTFYRPTENHVGVIYSKWGKFKRFASPDKWTILSPAFEIVSKEVRLDMRTAKITIENVLTRDKVAIDIEMKAFFSVDVRETIESRRIQVLRFESENAWEEIVKTGITDIARNTIILSRSFDELVSEAGRSYLKQALSSAVAHRVRSFGILMNRFAVSIMNLQPNKTFQQALQEETVAKTLGNAAAERVRPLFDQFSNKGQERAFLTLIMQMAAAVAKTGEMPIITFPNTEDHITSNGFSGNGHDSVSPSNQKKMAAPLE